MDISTVECSFVGNTISVQSRIRNIYVAEPEQTTWTDKVGKSVTKPLYENRNGFIKCLKNEVYNLNSINDQLKSFSLYQFDKTRYLSQIHMNRV